MSKVDDILKQGHQPAGEHVGKIGIIDELAFFDNLEIDESAIEARRNGGGEAIAEDDADCEGCKI